ncbi:MAG: hypothetical protein GY799_25195 [Desulfobulbaceae bacterium]|nr:hypothetical protein [Desulfobulbaceae bacterium]
MSGLELKLGGQLQLLGVPEYRTEYRFAAIHVALGYGLRKRLALAGLNDWRFDMAWPNMKFAVEIEGGAWVHGRHTRGKGFEDDLVKYHHGKRLGWDIYRCSGKLIDSGEAAILIRDILKMRR